MAESDKISVVVLVRNSEATLERCMRSLFSQTYENLEYVIINDASTDGSMDILERTLEDFPHRKEQLLRINLDDRVGQAKGREIGIRAATGSYIIHCDSDDYVEPEMYADLREYAEKNNCDMVRCLRQKEYPDGKFQMGSVFSEEVYKDKRQLISNLLLNRGLSSLCTKLVKRELFDVVSYPPGDTYEDFAIVLQLFYFSRNVGHVDKMYYHYVQMEGSTMNPQSEEGRKVKAAGMERNIAFMVDFLRAKELDEQFNDELATLKLCVKYSWWHVDRQHFLSNWRKCFPEVMAGVWNNRFLSATDKLKAKMFDMGMVTPFVYSLFRKLSYGKA